MENISNKDISMRFEYLRKYLKLSQEAFGKPLEFSQGHISEVESGKKPPSDKLIRAAARHYSVPESWLRTGDGNLTDYGLQPDGRMKMVVQMDGDGYDPHGGWKPRSIEEMTGVPKGLGLGKAVDMLATIYAAKDEMLIRAINANLEAFCSAVGEKERRIEREQDLERLEARVKELENIIAKNGLVQV